MPPTTWPTRASVSERSMSVKVDDQVDIVELDERHIASERLRLQTLIQRASLGASNAPCVPKASCTFAVYIIRCTEAGKTWEVRRRWTDIRITVDLLRASEGFTSALFTSPAMPSFDAHGPWWRIGPAEYDPAFLLSRARSLQALLEWAVRETRCSVLHQRGPSPLLAVLCDEDHVLQPPSVVVDSTPSTLDALGDVAGRYADAQEAVAAGESIVLDHARGFLASYRAARRSEPTFVDWIHELHPENCNAAKFGSTEAVDPRIHAAESNFRALWAKAQSEIQSRQSEQSKIAEAEAEVAEDEWTEVAAEGASLGLSLDLLLAEDLAEQRQWEREREDMLARAQAMPRLRQEQQQRKHPQQVQRPQHPQQPQQQQQPQQVLESDAQQAPRKLLQQLVELRRVALKLRPGWVHIIVLVLLLVWSAPTQRESWPAPTGRLPGLDMPLDHVINAVMEAVRRPREWISLGEQWEL